MNRQDIFEATQVLSEDPILMRNWLQLCDSLRVNYEGQVYTLQQQWNNGTLPTYSLVRTILAIWQSQEGDHATWDRLIYILNAIELKRSADKLRLLILERNNQELESANAHFQAGRLSPLLPEQSSSEPALNWQQFRAEKILGRGSFGMVFQVRDSYETTSAIKLVVPLSSQMTSEFEKAKREFELMREFHHMNIVSFHSYAILDKGSKIHETFVSHLGSTVMQSSHKTAYDDFSNHSKIYPTICIQMELCSETLRKWLDDIHTIQKKSKRPLEFDFAKMQIEIAQGIIQGLKYLHNKNILHRDLKPDNIFFKEGTEEYSLPIKIGDFGIAREVSDSRTQTMTRQRGTPLYMAPEIARGERQYGKSADLFSLGLVLLEVFQYIEPNYLANVFDQLVVERNPDIVQEDNQYVTNLRTLIVGLTQRNEGIRTSSINHVELDFTKEFEDLNQESDEVGLC